MRLRLLLLVVCLAAPLVCAQALAAGGYQITKIKRELVQTPEYDIAQGPSVKSNGRDRWLQVEVDFFATPEFTDELSFKYYLLIDGRLLTGEVTHVNIVAGKERHSVMYVPPKALAHLLGNRAPTANSLQNVAVQLLLKGEVKDELSLVRSRPQWFSALAALNGFVLNKNETPFAPLFWDRYEQIKPAGAR